MGNNRPVQLQHWTRQEAENTTGSDEAELDIPASDVAERARARLNECGELLPPHSAAKVAYATVNRVTLVTLRLLLFLITTRLLPTSCSCSNIRTHRTVQLLFPQVSSSGWQPEETPAVRGGSDTYSMCSRHRGSHRKCRRVGPGSCTGTARRSWSEQLGNSHHRKLLGLKIWDPKYRYSLATKYILFT